MRYSVNIIHPTLYHDTNAKILLTLLIWRFVMKIAVVYTATTPELTAGIADELNKNLSGIPVEIASYQNPAILQEARDNGGPTANCVRKLMDLYEQSVDDGANVILNACSSVGRAAKLAKPLYELSGTGFVRIDEEMAHAAVRAGSRIGIVATLPTTLEPTKELVQDCADLQGKPVHLVDALAEGAFGLDQTQFKEKLIETGRKVRDRVDVLLFAQGSMAYAEKDVSDALGLPVFSSIRFGVEAAEKRVREMMEK